ncbi:hypothetical protein B0J14DRAFT_561156 [Halenospora varia]|nr:hypothetical protein B0J14DRAFT_561156 [Halenospora varia]
MAFSFGNSSMGGATSDAGGNAQNGPDLEEIQTEGLGFLALAGEAKVQLLSTPWPSEQLPPTTASLMSVASKRGLVAAAGPDAVILASTKSVRGAFEGKETGDNNLKPFQPELKLPMPMRISQLAFSADEAYLILSAETGGGLAVYDVQALMGGSTQSAFELSTTSQSLRALIPNPTPEKGELIAVVTNDGNLMMANLKERNFIQGPNGQVLKDGVSCVSWSTKGKQLVAGLGNGGIYQMTPEGVGKAEIPKPPNVASGEFVSSITWLENHVFLVAHTPSNFDNSILPNSSWHLITRQPPANFMFQKITDPAGPFSSVMRQPPHQFLLRLKDFHPNLQDFLIVGSTASTDIGLFTRAKTPLAKDKPADKITGVFTMTEMSDDSRRAQMPMSSDLNDTSPIGFALDLSSTEKVLRPIPGDELDESLTPLPAFMVLNNEGVLAAWWIIYSESVRQGMIYPGLVAAGDAPQATQSTPQAQTTSAFGAQKTAAFGSSAFGAPSSSSAFGAPQAAGAFGKPAFGTPSTGGAFGAPSGLGQKASPWGTPAASTTAVAAPSSGSAFGTPAFGTTSGMGQSSAFGKPAFGATTTPSFGASGLPGNRPSPWATGSTAPNAAFGQSSGLTKAASPFGTPAATPSAAPTSGGFSAFANKGGFTAASSTQPTSGSIFGSKPATGSSPFGTPSTNAPAGSVFGGGAQNGNKSSPFGGASSSQPSGIFGSTDTKPATSIFGGSSENKPASVFGGANNFKLGTTFKADESAKDDAPATSENKGSFFGGGFGSALGEASKTQAAESPISKEADMDAEEPAKPVESAKNSTTPASTPAPSKFQPFPSTTPASGGLFGSATPSSTPGAGLFGTTAQQPTTTKPATAGFSFGKAPETGGGFSFSNLNKTTSAGPKTPTTSTPTPLPTISQTPATPRVKEEPEDGNANGINQIPEAPLPPDPTSKNEYPFGDSPSSSEADSPSTPDSVSKTPTRAPTPPPPVEEAKKPIPADLIPPMDVPGGPEDEGDDEEDWGSDDGQTHSASGSEEGSGEDISKDLSPTSDTQQTPAFTPQHSFGLPKKPNESSMFQKIQPPSQPGPSRSLFGEIGAQAPSLPPPAKAPQSPRSPSPVRGAIPGRMLRPDASRSVSAPGVASQILGAQRPSSKAGPSTFNLTLEQQRADERRRAEARARKEAEETQALVDEEDDQIQRFLDEDLVPTRTLDEFVAHTDYGGASTGDSIPAQVEAVYRDINSMIDTLGVNAKALKSFIRGHTEQYKEAGRTKEDLEDPEDWCLVELEDLAVLVEKDLTRELDEGRIRDVATKLETCNDLQKDLIKLRAKHEDIKKIVQAHRDPDQVAMARNQPLSSEQAAQQHDLRRDFTKFQKLLSEAEEGLTLLKTKIVSQATSNGRTNSSAAPTVEAVMRTITKMTTMAEKRSGDIDVLEGQMRKLRFSSTASVGSREGSPFTPQASRQSARPGTSSTYGLFYTPESARESTRALHSSIMSSSPFSRSSPGPRKKLSGYSAEEKDQLRTKLARRKEVMGRLKGALERAGTSVRPMEDEA